MGGYPNAGFQKMASPNQSMSNVSGYSNTNQMTPNMNQMNMMNQQQSQQQTQLQPMNQDEEYIFNAFEKYVALFNNTYPDENKQKDFNGKLSSLFSKLKNHELKVNLLKLLIDFINGKFYLIIFF